MTIEITIVRVTTHDIYSVTIKDVQHVDVSALSLTNSTVFKFQGT